MMLRATTRIALSVSITIGGIVAACRNEMPGPSLPLLPEVSPQGPRPGPITPTPARIDTDAGIPLPTPLEPSTSASSFGHARRGERLALRVADAPRDAGVSDVIDLPPVPDANFGLVRDAGQPMK